MLIDGLYMPVLIIGSVGLVGCAILLAHAVKRSTKFLRTDTRKQSQPTQARAGSENRLRPFGTTMRSDDILAGAEEPTPTPLTPGDGVDWPQHDHTEMMRGPYPLPLTTRILNNPLVDNKAGIHFPFGGYEERLEILESNQRKAADNMSSMIKLAEKMADRILEIERKESNSWETVCDLTEELGIVQNKLADSIFILYGGKKPDGY